MKRAQVDMRINRPEATNSKNNRLLSGRFFCSQAAEDNEMTDREKLQHRAQLIKECRQLIDKADQERRELTVQEERTYAANIAEIDRIAAEVRMDPISRQDMSDSQYIQALETQLRQAPTGPIAAHTWQPMGNDAPATAPGEVRTYRREERLFDVVQHDPLPDGIRPEELSAGRFIRALITGNWKDAQAERRAMSTVDGAVGGYLLASPMSLQVVDLARAQSVLQAAGCLTVPMDSSKLTMARVTKDPVGYWKAENADGTESDMEFGSMQFNAHTLMAVCRISRELAEDAPNAADAINNALSQALSLTMDYEGMFGVGASGPRGLANDPDLSELDLGTNGANVDWYNDLISAYRLVLQANGAPKAVIFSPRETTEESAMKDGSSRPLVRPKIIADLNWLTSNQIPNNLAHGTASTCATAFLGDFSKLVMGLRQNITIEVSKDAGTAFGKHQVLIKATLRGDFNTTQPAHIARIVGILPRTL